MAEDAKISFTTKTRAGDLLTVRGDDGTEFHKNLHSLTAGLGAADIQAAMLALYEAAQKIPPPYDAAEYVKETLGGTEIERYEPPWKDAAPQQLPQSMTPSCQDCGAGMRYEEWTGKSGKNAGREFKAWKCTRDKDHKVQWVN